MSDIKIHIDSFGDIHFFKKGTFSHHRLDGPAKIYDKNNIINHSVIYYIYEVFEGVCSSWPYSESGYYKKIAK